MKMLSRLDCVGCDKVLEGAIDRLKYCVKKMKGKYGTRRAVSHIEFCLSHLDDVTTNDKYTRNFYQQFRNPPNTPKSRRLGWHEGHIV